MKTIFRKHKHFFFFLEDIKKDFQTNNFPSSRRYINERIRLIFPLYAPKMSFFKITGKLAKNFKANNLNQTLHIQSIVSKNKVVFKLSPKIPFIYIF